jgi:hypothetical protein
VHGTGRGNAAARFFPVHNGLLDEEKKPNPGIVSERSNGSNRVGAAPTGFAVESIAPNSPPALLVKGSVKRIS